eukprot:CFRG7194T1
MHDPKAQREWTFDFFDCFSDGSESLTACFLPCFTYADIKTAQGGDHTTNCMIWFCFSGCCCGMIGASLLDEARDVTKGAQNISESDCASFLGAWCCTCCSMVQLQRELKHIKEQRAQDTNRVITSQPAPAGKNPSGVAMLEDKHVQPDAPQPSQPE